MRMRSDPSPFRTWGRYGRRCLAKRPNRPYPQVIDIADVRCFDDPQAGQLRRCSSARPPLPRRERDLLELGQNRPKRHPAAQDAMPMLTVKEKGDRTSLDRVAFDR